MKKIRIFNNVNALAKSAARFVYEEMLRLLEKQGEVSFIISGDLDIPFFFTNFRALFNSKQLLKLDINWFSANEAWAGPLSNLNRENRLRKVLFDFIRPPEENIFSWQVMYQPPFTCAQRMNNSIENFFISTGKKPDITLLTMDEDGNIAALFPGSRTLISEQKMVPLSPESGRYSIPVYHKEHWYMSLSPGFLNQSGLIIVFIPDKKKQQAFKRYLEKTDNCSLSWIKAANIYFYLTREAAGSFVYKYAHKS